MNPKHPDFKEDSDCPVIIELDDSCEFFEKGANDYKRFKLESLWNWHLSKEKQYET